jgi:MscS family membrane protein
MVVGFMNTARDPHDTRAPLYLNTTLRGNAANELAHKLFVVLNNRLPARLNEVSDQPEGSLSNPLDPNTDFVGTVTTASGPLDIVVERVNRGTLGPVWLFSRATLAAIPRVYDEVDFVSIDRFIPAFLTTPRILGIRLSAWLLFGLLLPASYRLTGLLGRLILPFVFWWRRRRQEGQLPDQPAVPGPVRLLLVAILLQWLLGTIAIPLLERQFWSGIVRMLVIVAVTWGLLLLNEVAERSVRRRLLEGRRQEITAMLRLVRRLADAVVIAAAGFVTLHLFGIDATAVLAGLGIGGIAVALAAQKTLENVVGGVSIILDQAVRVGDFLKLGETAGTVHSIGLRSTRIRTLDRTILSVPNGQIANVNVETLSARDKFWFHHVFGLTYDTTAAQMRAILESVRQDLYVHPMVDRSESVRVRFFRLGPSSLDVEVVAYLLARDWEEFLETQQELLLGIMDVVERTGAEIAFPSQTLHIANARGSESDASPIGTRSVRIDAPRQAAGPA